MANKIFVGSLPWKTDDQALADLFMQAGPIVSARVMRDRMTGRSRGFGFVEYEDAESTAKAIEMFNGYEYEGRALTVNEAQEQRERPPRRDFGGNDRGGRGGHGHGGHRGGDQY